MWLSDGKGIQSVKTWGPIYKKSEKKSLSLS